MRNLRYISIVVILPFLCSGCASLGKLSPLRPLERSIIYHPQDWPDDFSIPEGAPIEEVSFAATDGTKLHGLFVAHPNPRGVALFCHGNAGNVAGRVDSLGILNRGHQLSVLMFDYRGYGKSEGRPDEKGLLLDARAGRKWLAQRTGVSESDIIIMGRSLGGGVAVDLAANDGAKALVLASTFTSLPDVAKKHLKYIPARLLMTQQFDSSKKLSRYDGPLLQTHGRSDNLIPIELARQLHAAAGGEKTFIEVEGGHNAPQSPEYRQALDHLLDSLQ